MEASSERYEPTLQIFVQNILLGNRRNRRGRASVWEPMSVILRDIAKEPFGGFGRVGLADGSYGSYISVEARIGVDK